MGKIGYKWIVPTLWTGSLVFISAFSLVLTFDFFTEIFAFSNTDIVGTRYWGLSRLDLALWFIRILFFITISFVGGLYLQGFYIKYDSYEALFLFLWLLGLSFIPWRLLSFKMSIIDLQTWGVFFSRYFTFLEIMGFSFLLLSGIVFANRHIQNIWILVISILIFSLTIAWHYPINSFWLSKRLMLGWAISPVVAYTNWILNFLALLTVYLDLYFRKSISEALTMIFSTLFLYGGWVLINFFNYHSSVILGGILLCVGIWLYIRGISRYYAPWQ